MQSVEEKYNYLTKNRKLVLVERGKDGKIESVREFSKDILEEFIRDRSNSCDPMSVARNEDLNLFTEEQLEIIRTLRNYQDYRTIYSDNPMDKWFFFTNDVAMYYKNLFDKYNMDTIRFATELCCAFEGPFIVSMNSPYARMKFTFQSAVEFINSRKGIYYAIRNDGEIHWHFIDKPTKKQAQYQRQKHGNRIVFYSFMSWKEHIIHESELD